MGVPLPQGFDSVERLIQHVRATQPVGYAESAALVFRYIDGCWQDDTRSALARVFPLSHSKMNPVGLPLLERVSETKATAFDGDPSFDLVNDAGEEVEAAPDGTTWDSVLEDANLVDVLRRADERTVAGRLVFLRVSWDSDASRLRLDRFDPQLVFPAYDLDNPTMQSASGVLLELKPDIVDGKPRKRYELWTAEVDENGNTLDARAIQIDEKGEFLSDVAPGGENPYKGPNGHEGYPVLPVIAFGDTADEPWPEPRESLVDAQRALNVRKTNLNHVELLQAHGQWVSGTTDRNADSWSGASAPRGSETSRLGRDKPVPTGVTVPIGPDTTVAVPFGRTFQNVAIQAQLAELRAGDTSELRDVAIFEGIPPGRITGENREVSGVALLVENAPLARYRQKRIPTFKRQVADLLDVMRIVWNTHVEPDRRFPESYGRFTADTPPVVVDPVAMLDRAQKMKTLGVHTNAEIRAAATGESVEDAGKWLEEHAAEIKGGVSADLAASRNFPSALQQQRDKAAQNMKPPAPDAKPAETPAPTE